MINNKQYKDQTYMCWRNSIHNITGCAYEMGDITLRKSTKDYNYK